MTWLARVVRGLSLWSFRLATLLYPLLMAVIVFNVVLRYGFSIGSIELEELQWHIYSAAFLLGMAQVFREDGNVRVDFLSGRFSLRRRRRIEVTALLVLLLPFLAIFTYFALRLFLRAWQLDEVSPHPSGLPARFVIKFILFFAFLNLLLQALAATGRRLFGREKAEDPAEDTAGERP